MTEYRDPEHIDPNKEHQISELAKFIREKMYGVDVRESIALALERVYDDASENGNSNMEVARARGTERVLGDRLDKMDQSRNSLEKEKMDRGESISVSQLDKNKGKIDETYLSEELLEQMAGETPIHATPANKSLTSVKYANESVLPQNTNFIEQSSNLVNELTLVRGALIGNDGSIVDSDNYSYSDFILVDPETVLSMDYVYSVAEYDSDGTFIRRIYTNESGRNFVYTVPANVYFIVANVQLRYGNPQINKGEELLEYEKYGIGLKNQKPLKTEEIEDKSVTSSKTTMRDTKPLLVLSGETSIDPNFNTDNKTLTIFAGFWLTVKKERIRFTSDVSIAVDEISSAQYVLYDTESGDWRMLGSSRESQIKETELTVGYMTFSNRNFTTLKFHNLGVNITVDGKLHSPQNELGFAVITNDFGETIIDFVKKKVTFEKTFWLTTKKTVFEFVKDIKIDFSKAFGNGANVWVFFDILTEEFSLHTARESVELPNNMVPVIIIYRQGGVFMVGKHKVIKDTFADENEKTYYFVPDDLIGHYKPNEIYGYDDFDVDPNITSINYVYDKFDDLANEHPDYIFKELLGKDQSDTYDIYKYTLKGLQPETTITKKLPKILLCSGLHGGEKDDIFALYYLIKDICENWKSDPLLEYLRFNVEIKLIISANPWGFMYSGDGRMNSRGVDLNRNFSVNWLQGSEGSRTWGGPNPFSEVESVYVKEMIDDDMDALYFANIHSNGSSGNDYEMLMWNSPNDGIYHSDDSNIIARQIIAKQTREFTKRYNQPNDKGFFGNVSGGSNGGFSKVYAAYQGIPSSTIEVFRKFPNQEEYHNPIAIRAVTEYLGNWIVTLLKHFKNK